MLILLAHRVTIYILITYEITEHPLRVTLMSSGLRILLSCIGITFQRAPSSQFFLHSGISEHGSPNYGELIGRYHNRGIAIVCSTIGTHTVRIPFLHTIGLTSKRLVLGINSINLDTISLYLVANLLGQPVWTIHVYQIRLYLHIILRIRLIGIGSWQTAQDIVVLAVINLWQWIIGNLAPLLTIIDREGLYFVVIVITVILIRSRAKFTLIDTAFVIVYQ